MRGERRYPHSREAAKGGSTPARPRRRFDLYRRGRVVVTLRDGKGFDGDETFRGAESWQFRVVACASAPRPSGHLVVRSGRQGSTSRGHPVVEAWPQTYDARGDDVGTEPRRWTVMRGGYSGGSSAMTRPAESDPLVEPCGGRSACAQTRDGTDSRSSRGGDGPPPHRVAQELLRTRTLTSKGDWTASRARRVRNTLSRA